MICNVLYTQWVNGKQVMEHDGGHLPFEAEITECLTSSQVNRVTVAVNNTLNAHTLPPGSVIYNDNLRYSSIKYF